MKPWEKLTNRQLLFDALVAAVVLVLGLIGRIDLVESSEVIFSREEDALHFLLIVSMAAPLVLRRVYPIPVFVVVLGSWIVDRGLDYPDTPAAFAVGVVFYTIGVELDRRTSLLIGGVSSAILVGWTAVGIAVLDSVHTGAIFYTLIATLTPLLLGREIHERRLRVEELERRAERAEKEREERAQRAVTEERARIARELHDVVAHQMTVMTIQAEGARRVADGSDARIVEALDTIKEAGHSALAEMRRLVGLLRDENQDGSDLTPLPNLGDLSVLVDQMEAAGLAVDVEMSGSVRPLPESVELSAFRLIQESLTNTARHGGPDVSAQVKVTYGDDSLDLLVVDDGRGSAANSSNGGGHGLVGMKERVAVLGGTLAAGPGPGGGYRVHAVIPYES